MNNINIEKQNIPIVEENNINIKTIDNNNKNINNNEEIINEEEYESEKYDINQFKNIIYKQNFILLQINIQELQKILTEHLKQLDNLYNNEMFLLNLLNM